MAVPSPSRSPTHGPLPEPAPIPFVALEELFARAVLDTRQLDDDDASLAHVRRVGPETLPLLHRTAHAVTRAFAAGVKPALTDWNSTGGAYFINDAGGKPLAVLKPLDEEPYTINNPKRHNLDALVGSAPPASGGSSDDDAEDGATVTVAPPRDVTDAGDAPVSRRAKKKARRRQRRAAAEAAPAVKSTATSGPKPVQHYIKKGIMPGEGAAREVAAYLLDHGHHAGVPPTALVIARHPTLHVSQRYLDMVKEYRERVLHAFDARLAYEKYAALIHELLPHLQVLKAPVSAVPSLDELEGELLRAASAAARARSIGSVGSMSDAMVAGVEPAVFLPSVSPPVGVDGVMKHAPAAVSTRPRSSTSSTLARESPPTIGRPGSEDAPTLVLDKHGSSDSAAGEAASLASIKRRASASAAASRTAQATHSSSSPGSGSMSLSPPLRASFSHGMSDGDMMRPMGLFVATSPGSTGLRDASSGGTSTRNDSVPATSMNTPAHLQFSPRLTPSYQPHRATRKPGPSSPPGASSQSPPTSSHVSADRTTPPTLDTVLQSMLASVPAGSGGEFTLPPPADASATPSVSSSSGKEPMTPTAALLSSKLLSMLTELEQAIHMDGAVDDDTCELSSLALPPYKTASLQLFVPHNCSAEDVSSSAWPVDAVHRLAIHDIRLGNTDRNDDNILIRAIFDDASVRAAPMRRRAASGSALAGLHVEADIPVAADTGMVPTRARLLSARSDVDMPPGEADSVGAADGFMDADEDVADNSVDENDLDIKASYIADDFMRGRHAHSKAPKRAKSKRGTNPRASGAPVGDTAILHKQSSARGPGALTAGISPSVGRDGSASTPKSSAHAFPASPAALDRVRSTSGAAPRSPGHAGTEDGSESPSIVTMWASRISAADGCAECANAGSACTIIDTVKQNEGDIMRVRRRNILQRTFSSTGDAAFSSTDASWRLASHDVHAPSPRKMDAHAPRLTSSVHAFALPDVKSYPALAGMTTAPASAEKRKPGQLPGLPPRHDALRGGGDDSGTLSDHASVASFSTFSSSAAPTPFLGPEAALSLLPAHSMKIGIARNAMTPMPHMSNPGSSMPHDMHCLPTLAELEATSADATPVAAAPEAQSRARSLSMHAPLRSTSQGECSTDNTSSASPHSPGRTLEAMSASPLSSSSVAEATVLTARMGVPAVVPASVAKTPQRIMVALQPYASPVELQDGLRLPAAADPRRGAGLSPASTPLRSTPLAIALSPALQASVQSEVIIPHDSALASGALPLQALRPPAVDTSPQRTTTFRADTCDASSSNDGSGTSRVRASPLVRSSCGLEDELQLDISSEAAGGATPVIRSTSGLQDGRGSSMRTALGELKRERVMRQTPSATAPQDVSLLAAAGDVDTVKPVASPVAVPTPSADAPSVTVTALPPTAPPVRPWRSTRLEALRAAAPPPVMSLSAPVASVGDSGGTPVPIVEPAAGRTPKPSYAAVLNARAAAGSDDAVVNARGFSVLPTPPSTGDVTPETGRASTVTAGDVYERITDQKRLKDAKRIELVPIDHGLCLPAVSALDDVSCTWVHWKQSKQQLNDQNRRYVMALDGRADALMLRSVLGDRIRPTCLLTLRLCTELLKEGVRAGLTLSEIGLMMQRDSGVGVLPSNASKGADDVAKPPTVVGGIYYTTRQVHGSHGRHRQAQRIKHVQYADETTAVPPAQRKASAGSEDDAHGFDHLSALEQAIRKARKMAAKDKKRAAAKLRADAVRAAHMEQLEAATTASAMKRVAGGISPFMGAAAGGKVETKLPWNRPGKGHRGSRTSTARGARTSGTALGFGSECTGLDSSDAAAATTVDADALAAVKAESERSSLAFLPLHDLIVKHFRSVLPLHLHAVITRRERLSASGSF